MDKGEQKEEKREPDVKENEERKIDVTEKSRLDQHEKQLEERILSTTRTCRLFGIPLPPKVDEDWMHLLGCRAFSRLFDDGRFEGLDSNQRQALLWFFTNTPIQHWKPWMKRDLLKSEYSAFWADQFGIDGEDLEQHVE